MVEKYARRLTLRHRGSLLFRRNGQKSPRNNLAIASPFFSARETTFSLSETELLDTTAILEQHPYFLKSHHHHGDEC